MTREEVRQIIYLMEGVPQLIVKILYGSGLRIMEAVRLRVKDIDYQMKQLTVRSGKGAKYRFTTFPESIIPLLENHLAKVKILHEQDLAQGHGEVYLPYALGRKYRNAGIEWGWQYVFPSRNVSKDPGSGKIRRHHVDPVACPEHPKGHLLCGTRAGKRACETPDGAQVNVYDFLNSPNPSRLIAALVRLLDFAAFYPIHGIRAISVGGYAGRY